jgi:hypothetical protein
MIYYHEENRMEDQVETHINYDDWAGCSVRLSSYTRRIVLIHQSGRMNQVASAGINQGRLRP